MSAQRITYARAAYAVLVLESSMRGNTQAHTRGLIAALLVVIAGLSRAQAHLVVKEIV